MTAKDELLKFIFDNEFITKPRLKNKFELLVDKVIDEAQKEIINYIEDEAEIAMPVNELMHESGRRLTEKEYGHVLLKYLVIELREHFHERFTNKRRTIMENLTEILNDLEKGKISTDYAEEKVLRLFGVSGQLPIGEDMDGNQIFPHDTVLRDGNENLSVKIEYGRHREKFDCGYVVGWYVPDYCKKIER